MAKKDWTWLGVNNNSSLISSHVLINIDIPFIIVHLNMSFYRFNVEFIPRKI